jgi:cell division inhibitor SepF
MRHQWDGDSKEEIGQPVSASHPGFFEKVLNLFGFEAEEVVEETELAAASEEPLRRETKENRETRERAKVVSLANANKSMKMIIVEPCGFEEVQMIVDHLKNKQTVILNLEETDKSIARRIADFLGGAIYALDGSMQKVSGSILLFTPTNVEVALPIKPIVKEEEPERSVSASISASLFRKDRDTRRD